MALMKKVLEGQLMVRFAGFAPEPMKPGKDIAKSFEIYLKAAMNAGGFPTTVIATTSAAGMAIGAVFAMQLPIGASIGTLIGSHLLSMALTYQSGQQIGPPVVTPSHTPQLIKLFSGPQPSPASFAKELAGILDTWTKTWVVSGLIPGAPPVPFSGPLS
jgi:hypothetical protein